MSLFPYGPGEIGIASAEKMKYDAIASLEAKKKALLTKELLDKVRAIVSPEEYSRFLYLTSRVHYAELKELLDFIVKLRCVLKNTEELD